MTGCWGQRLRRLLRDGPQDPDLRRRWSAHSPMVSADDLGDALVREWDVDDQRPRFVREGVPLGMLPNPLHHPAAPREQVVEHLLRAVLGVGTSRTSGRGSPDGPSRSTVWSGG